MNMVLITLSVFSIAFFGMALGVLLSGKTIKGSCGGIGGSCSCASAGKKSACETAFEDD